MSTQRKLIYLAGNEKYHSSYLIGRGETLEGVYEDTFGSIRTIEELDRITSLNDDNRLVSLQRGTDYVMDDEGYLQYIKRPVTGRVYLVLEIQG